MKVFHILRSIVTSLLFFLLVLIMILQFIFTIVFINNKRPTDMISNTHILYSTLDGDIGSMESILLDYINEYKNYVFYKRSYPNIEMINLSNYTKEEISAIKSNLYLLRDSLDINYSSIIKIRKITNLLTNGSVFLLINIFVFTIYILLSICSFSFKKGTKLFTIALLISSIIYLIINMISKSYILKLSKTVFSIFLKSIIVNNLYPLAIIQSCICIIISLILLLIFYINEKTIKK